MTFKKYLLTILSVLFLSNSAYANGNESFIQKEKEEKRLNKKDVPNNLKDWVDWTIYDHKENNCNYKFNNSNERYCYYISELDLTINGKNAAFKETVSMLQDGYILLPGSLSTFPTTASIDNKKVPIINIDGFPYLFLKKGNYKIDGFIKSRENIRSLNIPKNAAIINVRRNNKNVNFINIDSDGILRLDNENTQKTETDNINVLAFRKIEDSIPLKMTLRIELNVSGKDRIETFKNIIPENFTLLGITSNIPAYIQKNGDLIAEVRAGRWNIDIEFRQINETLDFSTKNLINDDEIWVFVGNQNRRIIQMPNSMVSIQTKNTLLPESWKKYPAYQINSGDNISLTSVAYNMQQNDEIKLIRNIKLSFDGKFYSIKDDINGIFKTDGRMYLEKPFELSSVKILGIPQAITKIKGEDEVGFEIRKGMADITTNSRIDRSNNKIDASGYNRVFDNVKWNLTLAPGYELFYVGGADSISNSWITNWNLLNIFIVTLLIVFIYYLFDIKKAIFGGLLLILLHPLLPELSTVSFVLCATILIGRYAVEDGIIYKINIFVRYTLLTLLSITIISFMIINIRWSIYPALAEPRMDGYFSNFINLQFLFTFYTISAVIFGLSLMFNKEHEAKLSKLIKVIGVIVLILYAADISIVKKTYYHGMDNEFAEPMAYMAETTSVELPSLSSDIQYQIADSRKHKEEFSKEEVDDLISSKISSLSKSKEQTNNTIQYQNQNISKNRIQTGLGFPNWKNSSTVNIELKGPVYNNDKFNIYLISPKVNVILAFVRLLLSIYFVYFMADINRNNFRDKIYSFKKILSILALTIFMGLSFGSANAAAQPNSTIQNKDIPSKEILNELKEKLTKEDAPACIPYCVSIPNGKISNRGNTITLDISINAADEIVIPLPTIRSDNSNSVKVEKITNDGKIVRNIIKENDTIFLKLNSGINNISIKMLLDNNSDKFFLYSVFNIPYLVDDLNGFRISSDNDKNQSFQITRNKTEKIINNKNSSNSSVSKMNIEPFFTINRFLDIGTSWQVTTTVMRNNNIGENATIKVPLLKDEKVLTNEGTLLKDKILLSFSPNEVRKEFVSIIPIENEIVLNYPKQALNYNEIWSFMIDFTWNFKIEGLQPIVSDTSQMIFYPAAGDTLKLLISQPENVDGNTLTFDNVIYQFKPGRSLQELKLNLTIKSSESGFHNIALPKNSEIKDLKINYSNYPVIVKEGQLVIPVNQGTTNVKFTVNINDEITNTLRFPSLNLNAPIVNITEEAFIPTSRWILFTNGPAIGPSVLFWAQIPIWLCVAFILSRFAIFPLNFLQWFILLFGFMQTNIIFSVIVIAWFVSFALKVDYFNNLPYKKLTNAAIAILTLLFIYSLFEGVNNGLLGTWNMKIIGNNSQLTYDNGNLLWNLKWYQDVSSGELPRPFILSLPIFVYRTIMILWSIWLSFSFVKWIRWSISIIKNNGQRYGL